ncbi:MAG: hypothetical protein JSS89_05980 [Bacteroidetes bacterium]|nr:hypothetical protein [Bacteroidota bacterium]
MKVTHFGACAVKVILIFLFVEMVNSNSHPRSMASAMSVPKSGRLAISDETLQQHSTVQKSLKKRVKVSVAGAINLTWDNTTFLFVHDKKYKSALKLLKTAPFRFIDSMNGSRITNAWHCEVDGYLTQGDLAFILYVECFDPPMMDLFQTQKDFAWCQFGAASWLYYFRKHRHEVILKLTSYLRTSSGVQLNK